MCSIFLSAIGIYFCKIIYSLHFKLYRKLLTNLFNEAELEQDPAAAKAEDLEALLPQTAGKKRKARSTDADRFKGVPVEKKYLDLSEEDTLCPVCGTPLKEIGEEFVRRELVFVPAKR